MKWNSSHNDPPTVGQKVYYFGRHIGIGIGHYHYEERVLKSTKGNDDILLCPHVFTNINFGVVDGCDAPYWLPYDEKDAQSWCPIIPEQYTKGLYE